MHAFALVLTLSIAAFFVFARFRMSLVPLLVLFAGWALVTIARRAREGSWRGALAPAAVASLLAVAAHDPVGWLGPVRIEEAAEATTHNNLGTALRRAGRHDEAIEQFRLAIDAHPSYAPAHFNLGWSLLQAGELDAALVELREAERIEPTYAPDARLAIAVGLARGGDLEAAAAMLQELVASGAASPEAFGNLGMILRRLGRPDEAEAAYRQALAVRPSDADVHNNLAFLLDSLGRRVEAAEHYEAALRHDPRQLNAMESLAWLRAADPDAGLRDGAAAEALGAPRARPRPRGRGGRGERGGLARGPGRGTRRAGPLRRGPRRARARAGCGRGVGRARGPRRALSRRPTVPLSVTRTRSASPVPIGAWTAVARRS